MISLFAVLHDGSDQKGQNTTETKYCYISCVLQQGGRALKTSGYEPVLTESSFVGVKGGGNEAQPLVGDG